MKKVSLTGMSNWDGGNLMEEFDLEILKQYVKTLTRDVEQD